MHDLLIKDALFVTCDQNHKIVYDGIMAVKNGRITALEQSESDAGRQLQAHQTLSAKGRLVMPGLINTHCHAGDSLFRGLVEGLTLESWLGQVWVAEKAILTKETTYLGSVLGLAENLVAGVTTVMDMFWYPNETVRAANDLGMRLSTGGIFFDLPGIGDRLHSNYIKEAETFMATHQESESIFPAILPHGSYTVSPKHLEDGKAISDRYGALFSTHAAETQAEQADILNRYGKSVIRHLQAHDLLGPRSILAHCVHVDTTEIKMMADSGTIVAHNPMSNLKLGSGIAPVSEMLEAGIKITLGTDGAISGNDLDMWLTMRLAASLPKGVMMRADVVTAKQVLHMATLNGAEALGQSKNLGSLEPGKAADFIVLDLNSIHAVPMFDAITHLVYSTSKSDVCDVFVDGKQVVHDGKAIKVNMDQTLENVRTLAPSIKASLE